jgi:cytochrome c biogenesis protein CcmG/thiol:disulfide interchange protein DsbE
VAKASPAKRLTWGAIVLLAVFGGFLAGRIDLPDTVPDTPLIGTSVPDLALPLLEEDRAIRLTDFAGDILVVNFWASWCLPCRAEHPQLVQAAEHLTDQGVRFVSIDHEDRVADAIAFLDELGRSANQIVVVDEGSRAGIEFGIFGNPATFFVNREGVIVGKIIGPVDFSTVVSIVAQIEAGEDVGVRTTGEIFQGPDS